MSSYNNMRMIINDGHREGMIITASSEAGVLAAENTQNDRRALVWRTEETSATSALELELEVVMPVSIDTKGGIVLANTNLTLAADVSVEFLSGSGTVATLPLQCHAANPDGTTTWVAWVQDGPIDQYQLTASDPTNTDGYLQIVQIMCGPYVELRYNPAYGMPIEWLEAVEHIRVASQSIRSEGGGRLVLRQVSIAQPVVLQDDIEMLRRELLRHGKASPVFISIYPGKGGQKEADHQFVAKRDSNYGYAPITSSLLAAELVFLEV